MTAVTQINAGNYSIYSGMTIGEELQAFLTKHYTGYRPFILVDSNTLESCLPLLDFAGVEALREAEVLEVEPGENSKSVEVANQLWESLLSLGADRKSILVNLGGGMVTDLGGFVAATYKRGIPFIHLPTSLLAMVDASVGGKTGVNLAGSKNQVGLFTEPAAVFMNIEFLQTLPQRELLAGGAEMLKHGLIADVGHWSALENPSAFADRTNIEASVSIKYNVVRTDFKEAGERKKLNFGHTIGHALESWSFRTSSPLLHGEAVALGMRCEAYLSMKRGLLSEWEYREIEARLSVYPEVSLSQSDVEAVLAFMQTDKKNTATGGLNFTLLIAIGSAIIDQFLAEDEVREALLNVFRA